jgi:Double zinc ribbon
VTVTTCRACAAPLVVGATFCAECGLAIETADPPASRLVVADGCNACGSPLPHKADFCAVCGAPQTRTVRRSVAVDEPPFLPDQPLISPGPRRRSMGSPMTIAPGFVGVAVVALLVATLLVRPNTSRRGSTSTSETTTAGSGTTPRGVGGPAGAVAAGDDTTSVTTNSSVTATATGTQTQLAAINSLLDQSAAERRQVLSATTTLAACNDSSAMSSAIQSLSDAATTRQDFLNQLSSLPVDQIPDGSSLVSMLQSALEASVQSDQSYAAWGSDEEEGNCGKDDSNYQAAQGTDTQATSDKIAFVEEWNPLAAQYGFAQRSQVGL